MKQLMQPKVLWPLAKMTVRDPAGAGRIVRGLPLSRDICWTALILLTTITGLVFGLQSLNAEPMVFEAQTGELITITPPGPIAYVGISVALNGALIFLLQRIGAGIGGQGSFVEALRLLVWLQLVMVAISLAVGLLLLALPLAALASLTLLVQVVIYFRTLGHFVQVLHRFDRMGQAVRVILFSFLALFVAAFMLLAAVGPLIMGMSVDGL